MFFICHAWKYDLISNFIGYFDRVVLLFYNSPQYRHLMVNVLVKMQIIDLGQKKILFLWSENSLFMITI